jgi:YihY family inner membrane protein
LGRLHQLWTWIVRLLRFCYRVAAAFLRNRGILLAGGVGYNALLSLVPFLTLAVAALSLFFDQERIVNVLRRELIMLVPQHADTVLQTAQAFLKNQAATGVVSLGFMLFFSGIAFRMLEEAVDAIFQSPHQEVRRSFLISALLPYFFILLLMTALFVLTLTAACLDAFDEGTIRVLGLDLSFALGIKAVLRLAGFAGMVILFAAIYRVLPVVRISWGRAFIGGLCAAGLWRLVGRLMAYYFTNLSMVSLIYGSLATVVVVLLLLEVAFVIFLLGAQVIAELEVSAAAGLHWYQDGAPRAPVTAVLSTVRPATSQSG